MRHFLSISALLFLVLVPFFAHAEIKEIISEGTYNMGDGETPSVAESRALLNAKRIALEQAGTYVESYSRIKNIQLTADEIQVLASGIMEVEILEKKRTIVGEGISFWVKIRARVNADNFEKMAKRVKEKSVVENYKQIQQAYAKSQKEIKELKKQLIETKDGKKKKNLEAKIADDEKLFKANEWFEKGYNYGKRNQYEKEIEAYSKAISFNPNHWLAYHNRGNSYFRNKKYEKAIADFNGALALFPLFYPTYLSRGLVYWAQRQDDRAIDDFKKVIELNPLDAKAYTFRGDVYRRKAQYDEAFYDFNKAISIDPNDVMAYDGRGHVYLTKNQHDKAIEDFNKAIALEPNYTEAYTGRGAAYYKSGRYNSAIKDFSKTIGLDPNDGNAYSLRGGSYYELGNMGKAIFDLQKACDLGEEGACKSVKWILQNR